MYGSRIVRPIVFKFCTNISFGNKKVKFVRTVLVEQIQVLLRLVSFQNFGYSKLESNSPFSCIA